MLRDAINVLHLSDLHFGENVDPKKSEELCEDLVNDVEGLEKFRSEHRINANEEVWESPIKPDLVIITGDLSDSGLKSQFNGVLPFLDRLAMRLQLERHRFIIVPGNHDINRLLAESDIKASEGRGKKPVPPYPMKYESFISFFKKFYKGHSPYQFTAKEPWTLFYVEDLGVAVAGFNSTYFDSHRVKDHFGACGREQWEAMLDHLEHFQDRKLLRLSAIHHNLLHFSELDTTILLQDFPTWKGRLLSRINSLFHGHIHQDDFTHFQNIPVFSTGRQGLNPKEAQNRYQLVSFTKGYALRCCRRYDRKWVGDTTPILDGNSWFEIIKNDFVDVENTLSEKNPIQETAPLLRDDSIAPMPIPKKPVYDQKSLREDSIKVMKFCLDFAKFNIRSEKVVAPDFKIMPDDPKRWDGAPIHEGQNLEEIYKQWVQPGEHHLLKAVLAAPGAGKSVLFFELARWVLESQKINAFKQAPMYISLTGRELITEMKHDESLYQYIIRKTSICLDTESALPLIQAHIQAKTLYILLDALDEFGAHKKLRLQPLAKELVDLHGIGVNLFVTCRTVFWKSQLTRLFRKLFANPTAASSVASEQANTIYIDFTEGYANRLLPQDLSERLRGKDGKIPPWLCAPLLIRFLIDLYVDGRLPETFERRTDLYKAWIQYEAAKITRENSNISLFYEHVALEVVRRRRFDINVNELTITQGFEMSDLDHQQILEPSGDGGNTRGFFHQSVFEFFVAQAVKDDFTNCLEKTPRSNWRLAQVDLDYLEPSVYGFLSQMLEGDYLISLVNRLKFENLLKWPPRIVRNLIEYIGMTYSNPSHLEDIAPFLMRIIESNNSTVVRYNAARALERIHPSAPQPYFQFMSDWRDADQQNLFSDQWVDGPKLHAVRGYAKQAPEPSKTHYAFWKNVLYQNRDLVKKDENLINTETSRLLLKMLSELTSEAEEEMLLWINISYALGRWYGEEIGDSIYTEQERAKNLNKRVGMVLENLTDAEKFHRILKTFKKPTKHKSGLHQAHEIQEDRSVSTKEDALNKFLLASFSVDELNRFIRYGPDSTDLIAELPASTVSPAHFISEVVDINRRRGMIDADFFERLRDAHPKRTAEIQRLERQWLLEPGDTSPTTHQLSAKDLVRKRPNVKQKPAQIFVSYSHRDLSFVDELRSHLSLMQRQGLVDVWHDSEITAGEEWSKIIDEQLEAADIILLLVSASFLSSDFCWGVELKRAMERHAKNEAVVIPVILRSCLWQEAPFSKLKALPRDGKPIRQSRNTDEAWLEVASGIKEAVSQLKREGK